ncbi:hypothetical protein E4T56_gene8294 [Termitomyces sp. T112]|nr:hypothetical protein E4T56_gene8294 [Termitomyces sp. T112]
MSYSHYQQSPVWGTSQFGPPPNPSFQSQPYREGMYSDHAHAAPQDPSLFDDAWGRSRDPVIGYSMGLGVGTHEARHWHYRAYDLGELNRMSPAEVGHAAAYEAYRSWTTNPSMYEYGDIYRQRERLIGLAVGEAARLLAYVGQQTYKDARLTASETAAATASTIFYENREEGEGFSRGRSRSRLSSSGATYGGSYAYDNGVTAPHVSHHRSSSRPRSSSHSHPSALQGGVNMPSIPAIFAGSQYQGSVSGYPDSSPTYGTFPGNNIPLNMPTHGTPYPGTNVSLGAAASYTSHSYQPPKVQPYQGSTQPYHTQVYQPQPYQPQSLPINVPTHTTHQSHRGRSAGFESIRGLWKCFCSGSESSASSLRQIPDIAKTQASQSSSPTSLLKSTPELKPTSLPEPTSLFKPTPLPKPTSLLKPEPQTFKKCNAALLRESLSRQLPLSTLNSVSDAPQVVIYLHSF